MQTKYLVNLLSVVMTLCACALTATIIFREFPGVKSYLHVGGDQAEHVSNWRDLASSGQWRGPTSAKMILIEFSDFQCPACAQLNQYNHRLQNAFPNDVAVVQRHYPLVSIHTAAFDAALAAECAAVQGRFSAFSDALFEDQASIPAKDWKKFAKQSQVEDLADFAHCVDAKTFSDRVKHDLKVGKDLFMTGTPLLIANGRRFDGLPAYDVLVALTQKAIAKR